MSSMLHLPSLRRAAMAMALALLVAAGAALLPSAGGNALGPATASAASPTSCVAVGRNLVGFASSGNAWLALNAARRVPGCGAFNADAICWTSRQWWGGGARAIVRLATWGRYDRC